MAVEIHSSLVVYFPGRKFPIGSSWLILPGDSLSTSWRFPVETTFISPRIYCWQYTSKDQHSTSRKLRITKLGIYAFGRGQRHTDIQKDGGADRQIPREVLRPQSRAGLLVFPPGRLEARSPRFRRGSFPHFRRNFRVRRKTKARPWGFRRNYLWPKFAPPNFPKSVCGRANN